MVSGELVFYNGEGGLGHYLFDISKPHGVVGVDVYWKYDYWIILSKQCLS